MLSPEAAPRIIGRLFRADGDHITDLQIPVSNRPVEVVLWHSRVFQYKGTEAWGQPLYLKRPPTPFQRPYDAPLCRVDGNLAGCVRSVPVDRSR
jgi:hypothetical protein